jgi:hypothetical protein
MIRVERPRRVWDVVIAQSLKRDVRSPGLTNVADVTQDHANPPVIAVGMPVTGHPPHRAERARFGHSAPTLGD